MKREVILSPKKMAIIVAIAFFFICEGAFCYNWTHSKTSLILPILGGALCCALIVWLSMAKEGQEREEALVRTWLVVCAVLGFTYCFLMPVGCVPDEAYHYEHSYMYSDILLGQYFDENSLTMRRCDKEIDTLVNTDVYANADDYRALLRESFFASGDNAQEEVFSINREMSFSSNWPQIRLPSALGITLGRLLHLNGYITFYLGRLFNLAYYIVLVYFAIRITPIGKNAFMSVSLLPMTLHLAASLSYDTAAIGLSFLLAALCLRAIHRKERICRKEVIEIFLVSFLLVPAKLVYSAIALLSLLVPNERFSSKEQARKFRIGLVAVLVLTFIVSELSSVLAVSESETARDITTYSLSELLANPLGTIMIFINTFGTLSTDFLTMMIAGPLGWFQQNLSVPGIIVVAIVIVMIYSGLSDESDQAIPEPRLRAMLLVISGLAIIGAMTSMLLGWTEAGADVIAGVQGRYFIPIVPLILIGLRPRQIRIHGEGTEPTLVSMAVLNMALIACVYAAILVG